MPEINETTTTFDHPMVDRLKARCKVTHDDGCWIWQGCTDGGGYPSVRTKGVTSRAANAMFVATVGRKPRPFCGIGTNCLNKLCIAPHCLVERTASEKLKLGFQKGSRDRARHASMARGLKVAAGWATIDMEKAREIRRRRGERALDLASEFGIGESAVYKIWQNRTWREAAANSSVFNWRGAA